MSSVFSRYIMVIQVRVHPFSLQFEHLADADCVPTAADKDGVAKRRALLMCTTSSSESRFLSVFVCQVALAVLQSEIQDVWRRKRLACTHAHVNAINPAFKAR